MKRYIKSATHNTNQTKILTEICDTYNAIKDANDLKENNLSLADYHALSSLCNKLVESHKVKTLSTDCANWFKQFGCNVSENGYGNYIVSI